MCLSRRTGEGSLVCLLASIQHVAVQGTIPFGKDVMFRDVAIVTTHGEEAILNASILCGPVSSVCRNSATWVSWPW
jgi:hypothetical protein